MILCSDMLGIFVNKVVFIVGLGVLAQKLEIQNKSVLGNWRFG